MEQKTENAQKAGRPKYEREDLIAEMPDGFKGLIMWQDDLNKLIAKKPWMFGRLFKPRIIFLPRIFPSYWARTNMHFILLGKGLKDCPEYVRKYVLAHEYGHIYHLDTLPSYLLFCSFVGVAAGFFDYMQWLTIYSLIAFLIFGSINCLKPLKKEYNADDFSVIKNGTGVTIDGQKWMLEKTNSKDNPDRIARMSRLVKQHQISIKTGGEKI